MTILGLTLPLWGWILIFLAVLYLVVGVVISTLVFKGGTTTGPFSTKWEIIIEFIVLTIFWPFFCLGAVLTNRHRNML